MNLWGRHKDGPWMFVDTADEDNPPEVMEAEYRMAFGPDWQFEWRS